MDDVKIYYDFTDTEVNRQVENCFLPTQFDSVFDSVVLRGERVGGRAVDAFHVNERTITTSLPRYLVTSLPAGWWR